MNATYLGLNYHGLVEGERITPVRGCPRCKVSPMPHLMRTTPTVERLRKSWHPRKQFITHPREGWTVDTVLASNQRIFDTIEIAQEQEQDQSGGGASRDPHAVH